MESVGLKADQTIAGRDSEPFSPQMNIKLWATWWWVLNLYADPDEIPWSLGTVAVIECSTSDQGINGLSLSGSTVFFP